MSEKQPVAILVAGPNGAGKTTFARQFLISQYPMASFLNADEIQRQGPKFSHPVQAGRELLRQLAHLVSRRESFAVETTLSSRMYVKHINQWRTIGYKTVLHFIELRNEQAAIDRVAHRVSMGGHDIPESRHMSAVYKRLKPLPTRLFNCR